MKLIIVLSLFSGIIIAKDMQASKFWVKIGKKQIHLILYEGGFIEASCDKKCDAFKFLNQNIIVPKPKGKEVRNPQSLKCKALGGIVLIGKLYSGHSQSFCQGKDRSIVSTNIL